MMKKTRKEHEEKEEKPMEVINNNQAEAAVFEDMPGHSGEEIAPVEETLSEPEEKAATIDEEPTSDKEAKEPSAEEKLAEMQDKYLRLSAEFDNYRKRTIRERADLIKSAGEDVLSNILPVLDNFERAMNALRDSSDPEAVKEGIVLIYSKFKEFLAQRGIKEIDSLNLVFNPDLHDAITKFPVSEKDQHGKVIDVIEKGYFLNDKIIRHSKVVVGEYHKTVANGTSDK